MVCAGHPVDKSVSFHRPEMKPTVWRILIADDHERVRKSYRSLVETRRDLEVCGEATDGQEAVVKAEQCIPDLILLDVSMPVLDGFSAAKKIRELLPGIPILMLSMNDSAQMIRSSREAGAQGFVSKQISSKVLLKAVGVLLAGGTFFSKGNKRQNKTS